MQSLLHGLPGPEKDGIRFPGAADDGLKSVAADDRLNSVLSLSGQARLGRLRTDFKPRNLKVGLFVVCAFA